MPAQPYATVCAAELAGATEPLKWIAQGLFLESGAGILGGAPKSGKSFLALELCVAIASGSPCVGQFPIHAAGPVTLLCAEDPQAVVLQRLQALARAHNTALERLPIHVIVEHAVRLPDGLDRLRATLDVVDIVRIDHFRGFSACWEIPAGDKTAERGRWVEAGGLRYHRPKDPAARIIRCETFIRNVELLSRYLAATRE